MELNDLPIGEQIEHYYLEFKSQGGSKKVFANGNAIKHFEQAAILCKQLKANAHDFVASVFAYQDANRILPAFLHSKDVSDMYVAYMSTKVDVDLISIYDYNLKMLKFQLGKGFTEEEILLTKLLNFEAWFRLCYPKKEYPSIKEKWFEEASNQNSEKLRKFLFSKGHSFTRLFK